MQLVFQSSGSQLRGQALIKGRNLNLTGREVIHGKKKNISLLKWSHVRRGNLSSMELKCDGLEATYRKKKKKLFRYNPELKSNWQQHPSQNGLVVEHFPLEML